MLLFKNDTMSGAEFSGCREYRYALWRIWDETLPLIMFVGLNPSTANETDNDPTIRRVVRFAKDWGYGGVYMMNLFAFVTPYPEILKTCNDPVGDNDKWLLDIYNKCSQVVCAWGDFKEAKERAAQVYKIFNQPLALIVNKNGTPRHPLYVPANVTPVMF